MKVLVIKRLNCYLDEPTVNATIHSEIEVGSTIDIGQLVIGDIIDNNNLWYRTSDGLFVWSGGINDSRIGWSLNSFGIPKIWQKTRGKGINIAIIDTGVDLNNQDLESSIVSSYNVLTSNDDVQDTDGHGTYCSSIVASRGCNKMIGVAPESNLVIIKITKDSRNFNDNNLLKGINKAIELGADIISISLGSSFENIGISQLIKQSILDGKIFIAAAGNMTPHVLYPADMPGMISVNAASIENRQADYGNSKFTLGIYRAHGPKNILHEGITIVAPGDYIDAYGLSNNIETITGTSFAAPYVAGVIALLLSQKPNLNHHEIRKMLIDTANKNVNSFSKEYWGAGIIDPIKLIG